MTHLPETLPQDDEAETPPESVRRVLVVWHRVESVVAVLCFTFIASILLVDVVGREIAGPILRGLGFDPGYMGIFTARKLAVFALVIGSFAGIGIATATGSHIIPRVAFSLIPERWGPTMDRLADLITAVFIVGIAWFGWVFVASSKMTGLQAPMLGWPVWPVQMAIPLGFLSAAGRYFIFAAWPAAKPPPPETRE